jgi:hypothetical protein
MTMLDVVPHTRELTIIEHHSPIHYFAFRIVEYGEVIIEKFPFDNNDDCFAAGMNLLKRMHDLCPLIEEGGIE